MGSRPLRYTFTTQGDEYDLTSIQLTDLMIPTTTGWSVSVESVFISGIVDVLSLQAGLALNFYTNVATPENIKIGNQNSSVIGAVPLDSMTITTSPSGGIIWQNPNTWGTRTKWVLDPARPTYIVGLRYANLVVPITGGPNSYEWAQFTLAFYDERTGSDEVI